MPVRPREEVVHSDPVAVAGDCNSTPTTRQQRCRKGSGIASLSSERAATAVGGSPISSRSLLLGRLWRACLPGALSSYPFLHQSRSAAGVG